MRYVSLRIHNHEETGPSDDLISLFYALIEMVRSQLPWRTMAHTNQVKAAKELLVSSFALLVS